MECELIIIIIHDKVNLIVLNKNGGGRLGGGWGGEGYLGEARLIASI